MSSPQRLVRKLCPYCKKPPADARAAAMMGDMGTTVRRSSPQRRPLPGHGYSGRQAFFELLQVNDQLRDLVLGSPSMQDIQNAISGTKFASVKPLSPGDEGLA
jgi:type II secretory ATPase GspE/PulE/Tfp pilus assembly ATPase PilB-like protein